MGFTSGLIVIYVFLLDFKLNNKNINISGNVTHISELLQNEDIAIIYNTVISIITNEYLINLIRLSFLIRGLFIYPSFELLFINWCFYILRLSYS